MCLKITQARVDTLGQIKPLIAKRNIVCYKILKQTRNGRLRAPVQGTGYRLGKRYSVSLVKIDNSINEGLHTFISKTRAKREMEDYNGNVVAKAIIPKGSEYYIGNEDTQYVSTGLKLLDILT